MDAVRRGDETAFAALYDQTVGAVYGMVSRILANSRDVEEVVCDVYTQIWRISGSYDAGKGSVIGWMVVLSRSRALDFLRKQIRRSQYEEQLALQSAQCHDGEPTAESLVNALQEGSIVREVVAELPLVQQRVLALSFFQGYTHSEIAQALEMPLGTVKSHIRRALEALNRKCRRLGEHYGG